MAIRKASLSGLSFNKSISYVQPVAGGAFVQTAGPVASGGTTRQWTDSNGVVWKSHTFTSSGSFVVTSLGASNNAIELLVVGAGSGGYGTQIGGSGGKVVYYGGESLTAFSRTWTPSGSELTTLATGTYTVTIGAGQAASTSGTAASSSFIGTGISVTATGGQNVISGQTGAPYSISGNGIQTGTSGSSTYRNGGSGAAGQGAAYGTDIGASGGLGVSLTISGVLGVYGGGGGKGENSQYGSNMTRYRGDGSASGGAGDENGIANTGGGGGGGWNNSGNKNGGSGVVIVKYRLM